MAADREIRLLAQSARDPKARMAARLRNIAKLRTMRAWRRLLLDDGGNLTPDAVLALADLAGAAGMGKVRPDADAAALHFAEGKRAMALHVLARIDPNNLERLARQIREARPHGIDTTDTE